MTFDNITEETGPCHPERSVGSPVVARESPGKEILRFAQDDMLVGLLSLQDGMPNGTPF